MKTNVQNRVTNGMFLLNNNYSTTAIYANAIQQEIQSQAVMIESMIETIVEPIIFKC